MRAFMDIAKALADENRVRVLLILRDGELCVCQVVALLELAPSTVSRHMAVLRQARLVEARKVGKWVHYRRSDGADAPHVVETLAWVDGCVGDGARARRDRKALKAILRTDPEQLCRTRAAGA